ncbi:MAG: Ig-like domain-containing protein [Verrucomicrobiia bacterium]
MKRLALLPVAASALAALVIAGPALHAEFIQPVAVLASNGAATQEALINGFGFDDSFVGSPQSIHSRDSAEAWSGVGSIREYVVFDLGQTVSLTKIYIWNFNVADQTDVGMKDVEVQVSPDSDITTTNFNAIAQISLKEGLETAQVFDVVGTKVRLVKLKGLSNWGQGYTVGLAEVRFESGTISGNVPVIVLNSPHEGEEIAFGTDILIDARVTDADADLAKVEFFDGETLLTNKTAAPFTTTWKGAAQGTHAVRVVATDQSGKVSWVTANLNVRELVADRIVQIDDEADQGDGLYQIQYSGSWTLAPGGESDPRFNHNDHYNASNNKNDYFDVRFQGVMIEVFGTVASHHGSAYASIDGGPETKITYKTAQRAEQVLVWRSPILPNGEHVLRIRVGGDGVVTADRFDVSVSDKPIVTTATLKEVTATFTSVVAKLEDAASSVVDPASVKLFLDGSLVQATVAKAPPITTITHTPAAAFEVGSTHALKVEFKDMAGGSITNEQTFSLPAPFFPLTGISGPASVEGAWGLRQIWNAGRADSVVSCVEIAARATQPGFTGNLQDATVPTIHLALSSNPGANTLFPDPEPLPAESAGLTPGDFVVIGHAKVRVPRAGDWTLGVRCDDGYALRFVGAPFESVSGTGVRDDAFPEYIGFLTEGVNNTRAVLRGLAAKEYQIEFVAFQRVGSASFEIYAAEGAFTEDTETDQWQLVGGEGGWTIVAGPKGDIKLGTLAKVGDRVTIDFDSPEPASAHALHESTDLKSWQTVTSATFESLGAGKLRTSAGGATGATRFYRIGLR